MMHFSRFLRLAFFIIPFSMTSTFAAPQGAPSSNPTSASSNSAEQLQVENLTNNYWNQVAEVEVGVVQNRVYTKKHKIEFELFGGFFLGDPFVNSYPYGLSAGFHLNELFSFHGVFAGVANQNSQDFYNLKKDVQSQTTTPIIVSPEVNRVSRVLLAEGRASLMYGKISLLGKAIQYFDAFASLGLGTVKNQTDNEFALALGVGQQFHILKSLSLLISYRMLYHRETITVQQISQPDTSFRQDNFTHTINFGLCVFLGPLYN
jgi:outer membrane beta-barrel protein